MMSIINSDDLHIAYRLFNRSASSFACKMLTLLVAVSIHTTHSILLDTFSFFPPNKHTAPFPPCASLKLNCFTTMVVQQLEFL